MPLVSEKDALPSVVFLPKHFMALLYSNIDGVLPFLKTILYEEVKLFGIHSFCEILRSASICLFVYI